MYDSFDPSSYFSDPTRKAYLVRVYDEIAGFVLLNQATENSENTWNMGEFFIIAKFQGQGVARHVAEIIWSIHPGKWEVSVIPTNKPALKFWETVISQCSSGVYNKHVKQVSYDEHCPRRILFEFNIKNIMHKNLIPKCVIRPSTHSDIEAMISLSKLKRLAYEKIQPHFWRYAGEKGDNAQKQWFEKLLGDENYLLFTAESTTLEILGFAIGKLMAAPAVYHPRGLTLMIDDFCMQSEYLWQSVGAELIAALKASAKIKSASQIIVLCGAHDHQKRKFLHEQNLSIASEWFVG
jgi:predicted acetyltransferase